MQIGLGDATTSTTGTPAGATPAPGFTDGLMAWKTPGAAMTAVGAALSNPSAAFSGALLPVTAGLLIVPVGLVFLLMSMGKKGR